MLEAGETLNNQVKKSVVWYRLYTAPSPQSFRLPPDSPAMSINMLIKKILVLEKSIIGCVEEAQIKLSAESGQIEHTDDATSPFSL